ncbi:MAG: anti-sigma factor [Patulibacter sp.]|nr:anti-sigma factor [Patulibacter sp.]
MSRDPDLTDLIGPFVLGACTAAEEADVRAHMVVDPEFRREVESYAAVREALLDAPAPDVDADTAMKAQIMGLVREEAALFAAADPEPSSATEPGSSWRERWATVLAPFRGPRTLAVMATTLVVIVVAGVAIGIGGGTSDGPGGTVVAGQVLGEAAASGRAEVVVEGDAGELRVSGFPEPGQGRTYQVWVQSGQGAPRPTTVLFDVDRDGNATAKIPAQAMEGADAVLLTSEPDGGSPAPTRDPVLQVTMPA